jgi:hypothetical protein
METSLDRRDDREVGGRGVACDVGIARSVHRQAVPPFPVASPNAVAVHERGVDNQSPGSVEAAGHKSHRRPVLDSKPSGDPLPLAPNDLVEDRSVLQHISASREIAIAVNAEGTRTPD